jgi:hypothetical protein
MGHVLVDTFHIHGGVAPLRDARAPAFAGNRWKKRVVAMINFSLFVKKKLAALYFVIYVGWRVLSSLGNK